MMGLVGIVALLLVAYAASANRNRKALLARQRSGLLVIVSHQQLNVPGAKQLQL